MLARALLPQIGGSVMGNATWMRMVGGGGRAPGTFASTWTKTGVEPAVPITLPTITISGIDAASVVTPSTGITVSINGGAFGGATTMDEFDTIAARVTSGAYEAVTSGTVAIDGTDCAVSVTTRAEANYWLDANGDQILDVDGNPIEVIS